MVIYMINAILVIIGTIVGAGFASGKEIFTFFNIYGIYGLLGLLISILIIGYYMYTVFIIINKYNISSYSQFINLFLNKYPFFSNIFCNIVNIVFLISFIVMISGFSAFFKQEYNIPYIYGAIIICFFSFFTLLKKIDGIVKINKYLTPLLIFIIIFLGLKNIHCFTTIHFIHYSNNLIFLCIISSLLYAGHNLLSLFPILINLNCYIKGLKQAKITSLYAILVLLFMALILFILLSYFYTDIKNVDLPTVYIAKKLGSNYHVIFCISILGAIFTTAVSSGYAFLSNLNITNRKNYIIILLLMCIISIFFSNFGFTNLLNLLYPILGIIRFNSNNFYIIFY